MAQTHFTQTPNKTDRLSARIVMLWTLLLGLVAGFISQPTPALATNGVVLKVFHASPGSGSYDIYLDALPASVATLAIGQFTPAYEVNPGTHQIRVYPAGNTSTPTLVLTTNLARGKNYVVVLAGSGGSVQPLVLVEPPTAPHGYFRYRLVNLAPGSPPIELINSSNRVVIPRVSFTTNKYATLRSGLRYNFSVRLEGQPTPFQILPEFIGRSRKSYTVWVLSTQIAAAQAGAAPSAAPPADAAAPDIDAAGEIYSSPSREIVITAD